MVYLIPKDNLPQQSYTPAKYKGETVMMTIIPGGVVMMFLDIGENLFMNWDEIIAAAATAPRTELPEEKVVEPKPAEKKTIRQISKPN